MARLALREAIFRAPCGVPQDVGDSKPYGYEEAGTLWLWAFPELLGWPVEIAWMFSPVVHNKVWPGDLWGIDQEGNLLIVEAKAAGRGADPFIDFLGFKQPSVEALREHWAGLYCDERKFITTHRQLLHRGVLPLKPYPGVVPYSLQRREVRRWRSLYLRYIAPKLMGRRYQQRVQSHLRAREKAGSPAPHYVALFTLLGGGHAALSPKGERHYQMLAQQVGGGQLHMVAVRARHVQRWFCEIRSYRVNLATPP